MARKTDASQDTLLEFPCDYPVKVFGGNTPDFTRHVRDLLAPIIGAVADDAVDTRMSKSNRYLAVTIRFEATSKDQVDAVYEALTADTRVVMAL